jgi:hypothetical protein
VIKTTIPTLAGACALAATLTLQGTPAAEPAPPSDLSGFRFVHALVIDDPDNPLFGFHHFYADPQAAEGMAKGGPYAPGSTFVGLVYGVSRDGALVNEGEGAAVTLMTKDPDATETGGWRFAQFKPDGTLIEQDEKTACFQCHTQVEDRDYVFSQPLPLPLPGRAPPPGPPIAPAQEASPWTSPTCGRRSPPTAAASSI